VPELPEVETVRRGIERTVVGRRIVRVEVGRDRTVRRTSREALIDGLTGVAVTAAGRRGKYLLCPLDSGEALMVHLRMSGRLLTAAAGTTRPLHTHVVAHLAAGLGRPAEELWFVDPRTFGEVVVYDPANAAVEVPELARLGRDPIVDGLTAADLRAIVGGRRRQLKALLLDQHVIAGVGNIYADESLHRARLRPDRTTDTLTARDTARLAEAVTGVLHEAIEAGGSTLADTQYVDVEGNGGWFQVHHRVYDRAGEPCLTCARGRILRTVAAGRTTCFCPRCQR
jgi:formamidopyrimidine-DNA glycosylase